METLFLQLLHPKSKWHQKMRRDLLLCNQLIITVFAVLEQLPQFRVVCCLFGLQPRTLSISMNTDSTFPYDCGMASSFAPTRGWPLNFLHAPLSSASEMRRSSSLVISAPPM